MADNEIKNTSGTVEENLKFYELSRKVPDEAKKQIQGGRLKGFTDINPMWRIKKLTELFGPCGIGWYYEVINRWTEGNQAQTEVCAFVDIALYIKVDGEWSMPIHGTGGSKLITAEKSGSNVSDECYKMAQTDALSVACKSIGIGADVYWEKDAASTKYQAQSANKPESKPNVPDKNYPSRAKMLEDIYAKYPKDSKALLQLLDFLKVNALENATGDQLKKVWDQKCRK